MPLQREHNRKTQDSGKLWQSEQLVLEHLLPSVSARPSHELLQPLGTTFTTINLKAPRGRVWS